MKTPTGLNETALQELERRVRLRRGLPPPETCREIRLAAKVTLAEVAATVGVSRQAVKLWEAGSREPHGANLDAYATVVAALREATGS